ncbi:MAG: translocation/assembly module TamB [Polaribacter sp.]|nr:translocation/assembly module TamB [Polaribacter sp.]
MFKKIGKWLGYFVLFLLFLSIIFSIPFVQTKIGAYFTEKINEDFGTNIVIEKVDFSFIGNVNLKGVKIKDHHQDTLIFVSKLRTSVINFKRILDNQVNLKSISLDGVDFHLKTYKGETNDNLSIFIELFDDGKPRDSLTPPFILKSSNIYINKLNFKLVDDNKINPISYQIFNAGGNLQDFSIVGPDFSSKIRGLYFNDSYNLQVTNLSTDFTYSLTGMNFKKTTLQTEFSSIFGDIKFSYKREDLVDFNNKVNIKAKFSESSLAIKDLKKFYEELSGQHNLDFQGDLNGTLNNFGLEKFKLTTQGGIKIEGDLSFVNAVNSENGFVFQGDFKNLIATQKELKSILPNLLGKTLPSSFDKLGQFNIQGDVFATPTQVIADVTLNSSIGKAIADLEIGNVDNIDFATYSGEVSLESFRIGVLFNDSTFGKVSLNGTVKGSGFRLDNINTKFNGAISQFVYKDYNYKNITANGQYQNNKFNGILTIDDENFKMKFNGLADLSTKVNRFDFTSEIGYLNLKNTNLFLRDSISKLKGTVEIDVEGNTFDDIVGNATFKNIFYTNEKQEFSFKEFKFTSSIKDSIKTIEVNSVDIADGYLTGKFSFDEIVQVSQNALGSIYNNYEPYKVAPNQYLDFNFTIYNQIVTVFFPEVSIDNNTKIKGKIQSNKNQLKLTISSPKIDAYGNELKDVLLRTDNQNPLYNSHLTASEVNTKYYNVSKLNLLNRTENDTLFFKSEFKGGANNKEDFNLDFFYTINQEKKSVLGFEESTFVFKNKAWKIKPDETNTDKITFDLKKDEFSFSQFRIVSGEQKIEFTGNLKGSEEIYLLADFNKVDLDSFLPKIDSLSVKGKVTGHLDFIKKDNVYNPEAILVIKDFEINKFKQGDLAINIKGDNSFQKYSVDMSINNEKARSIAAIGSLDFSDKKPLIDLEIFMEDYSLDAFSPLGQDVISSLRGSVSGNFTLIGFLGNPEMEGFLSLRNAGLRFPYLNVDYDFEGESTISLLEQSFILEDLKIFDTKHKTRGILSGNISHRNFEQWFLDLKIDTKNLLVLDTENTEEALFYGTAFMDGTATISGLTDQLSIEVNAKTNPKTVFVVPLKDIETVNSFGLIHFKSDALKIEDRQREVAEDAIKGLSLDIDIEVTKDAEAQVVIDEVYGSKLTGRGSGDLQIRINTRGMFNMFGDFTIDSGVYDFKYGGIINKPFIIQKGGTVSWNGNPYEANLDVTAIYKAKANPGVLLENYNSTRKENIDLVTRISGGLFSSKQELDIKLTNVDPTIANELEFILNDNNINEKTTQFISLLAFGTFRNPDRVSFDINNSITGTASSAIAAAFSSLINSPDSKFQLGIDYQQGANNINNLIIDDQVDVSFSTQLSDRVIINGELGVPVGSQTQSSVIGEVKVEFLLNKEGNFRGVIFNRQNEIQYSTEEIGYTQGIGLTYQVNFNNFSELLTKIRRKIKFKKEEKKVETGKKEEVKNNISGD